MNSDFDILILGAGLSGLLCGAYLSKNGYKVCIIEKNKNIGGAIQTFNRKKITFDTGMHFFGAIKKGQIQYELFKLFGIHNKVEIEEIKEFNAIIEDKKYILPTGFTNYKKALNNYFNNETQAINKYLTKISEVINGITIEDIKNGFDLNSNHTESIFNFVKNITNNKELQDVLLFNNMLYETDAEKASIYIHSVINGSFLQSVGMFKNGTNNFLNSLSEVIKKNGSKIITSQEIINFNVQDGKIKSCISKSGKVFSAKKYISTLHPKIILDLTDTKIIKKFYRKRIAELQNTTGTFLIYIEMKKDSFLYKTPFFICDKKSETGFNTSYMINTPFSNKDGKYAKVVKIMFPMDFKEVKKWENTYLYKRPDDYIEFKKKKAEQAFNVIEKHFPNFTNSIENYYTSTPLTYRDYTGTINGSAYGIVNDCNNAIKSMLSVRTKIRNLYLSGQNINFHGMLGVSITSLITSNAIIQDDKFIKKV